MRNVEIILLFWIVFIFFGCLSTLIFLSRTGNTAPRKIKTRIPRERLSVKFQIRNIWHTGFSLFGAYFIAITGAELLVILYTPLAGLIFHSIILFWLLIQPVFMENTQQRDFLTAMSLVPLIRIISLAMPLVDLPQILWFPLIYFPLLIAVVITMKTINIKAKDIGIASRGLYWQIPAGLLLGLILGIIEFRILQPEPIKKHLSINEIWLPVLILFVTTGMVEELIFRGVLQKLAQDVMSVWGIVYISAIFAILHVGFYSVIDVVFVFFVAIIFAAIVKKTGSITGAIIAHGMTNTVLFVLGPFMLS
jgi:membrane protease YdiL (CAAX protease family)